MLQQILCGITLSSIVATFNKNGSLFSNPTVSSNNTITTAFSYSGTGTVKQYILNASFCFTPTYS
jgi:anaerobic C4-dicarboxylate transporter